MIKLCGQSLLKPASIILENFIFYIFHLYIDGTFPNICKKSNIPVHKKGDKKIIDNYRPVSLLLICGKIFKKLLFNSIFKFLYNNNLLCSNQSGFRPSDSFEYHLLSIVNDIYASSDFCSSLEVRELFLNISKAFC